MNKMNLYRVDYKDTGDPAVCYVIAKDIRECIDKVLAQHPVIDHSFIEFLEVSQISTRVVG